ncbi:CoA transferase [Advenella sp. WQ 585]|uniref:CoA transferase n=1 Tax=Advenella mandrilli TaxID=2800330 RepID=A0ABS1ECD5_9BURK|nr:CoA transferase [Advenella mandrilli]MBK1780680.1 CoA transferase [Advenella mandrilli]
MVNHDEPNPGPLSGIRVIDLSSVVMGPFATQMLADLGADVIKVEPPCGDNMRKVGPMVNDDMGALYLHLNRNKRSIVLDLKTEQGRQACLALAKTADVFLYNVRPQAMARLGLSYEDVSAVNPAIVYAGAYGFGMDGPYGGKPAYDDLIQGMTGIPVLYEKNSGDEPRYAPLTLADRTIGLQAAIACLAGVIQSRASGKGQSIEIPMFEGMSQFVLGDHLGGKTFVPEKGEMGYARLLATHRKPYKTANGHISVLIYNDKHWKNFLLLIGREDLVEGSIFSSHSVRADNIAEVYSFVAQILAEKNSEYWLDCFARADIPAAPLYSVEDLMEDPHIKAVNQVVEMDHPTEGRIRTPGTLGKYSATPLKIYRHAPNLGEHTEEILQETDLDQSMIDSLTNNTGRSKP